MEQRQANSLKKTQSLSNKISVIGAGGHARAVINLLLDLSIKPSAFFDDNILENESILGVEGKALSTLLEQDELVLAIGDNTKRKIFYNSHSSRVSKAKIHPQAYIGHSVEIGKGTCVFPNASLHALAVVGVNCIINTGAIVEHESTIGNHSHIAVGAMVCGRVSIGESCFVGAGAVVKDQISLCNNVCIGAGAVVVKNIIEPGVYVGNPAKLLKP